MTLSIKKPLIKFFALAAVCFTAVLLVFVFGSTKADAKTITIKTPEDFQNINWKNKGFGPGNTYKIGNDFSLGDGEYATCRLTKGKFVIDFNGHTVQNANHALTVINVSGANVVLRDSKVSNSKASVRSYGAGAVQITGGSLTINSGNYCGLSDGQNNPVGVHAGGGTCVINSGYFYGDYVGSSAFQGAKLRINGGTYQAGYLYGLFDLGGADIKISKGTFISGYKYVALGSYTGGQYFDFNKWLASKASYNTAFDTFYWNANSTASYYPSGMSTPYAATYNTAQLSVSNTMAKPSPTTIKSVKAKKKALTVKWKKKTNNTSGYIIQYSKFKKFKKGNKTITISKNSKASKTIKKLKSGKKYYVRIRTYKSYNGTKLYSNWSKAKSRKTK